MKKLLIIITSLLLLSTVTNAQLWKLRRYEFSAGVGTTQFYGDIGGYSPDKNILGLKDFTFKHTRFNINTSLRYRVAEVFSLRVNMVLGAFHSTDIRGANLFRGFESNTLFIEPSLIGEYYFIKNKSENSFVFLKGSNKLIKSVFESLDFYVFAGFGGLAYKVNPNTVLAHYVTKTSSFTGVVPVGAGVSMLYNSKIKFGIEFGGRYIFSDNIDGYTSALSKSNDVYHMVNFTFTYKLNLGNNPVLSLGR